MRMKLRQARKISHEMAQIFRPFGEVTTPRHTWFQWLQAQFVINRHMNVRVKVALPDGNIVTKTMGGLSNEHLARITREFGFRTDAEIPF